MEKIDWREAFMKSETERGLLAEKVKDLEARLGPAHPYKEGCYCSPCVITRYLNRIKELEFENHAALTANKILIERDKNFNEELARMQAILDGAYL
jgi:hypothetical protein